ncbi:MAG: tyrosine-type recombinase/integrase [Clostridium sp.]|nr:tyrosine-type recombinase/integrase [Clostridium sp.]
MTVQKIDKDYLFKVTVRMIGDEMHFSDLQMQKSINILTNVFAGIDFVSSQNMLSVDKSYNPTIIKNFMGCKKMGGIKDSSIEQYIYSISSLLKFCNKDLVNITTDDIRRFLLSYEKTVCKATANNCRRNLNVFFQFMENEEYIPKNPVKKIPKIKEGKKYKRFYTDLEIESMRDACVNKRELALIDLLISSGLRVSEVSNILLSEINWESRTIIIHGKGDKDRIVPFTVRCKKHLQEYLLERGKISDYLFCTYKKPYHKLGTGTINKIVRTVGERIGLSNITVHCFRRWLASDLNKKSVDPTIIQEILGHASFETTQKHYLSKSYDKIAYIHNVYAG